MSSPSPMRLRCVRALRQGQYTAVGVHAIIMSTRTFPALERVEAELVAMVEDGYATREWVERKNARGDVVEAYWVYTLTLEGDVLELRPEEIAEAVRAARNILRKDPRVLFFDGLRRILQALVQLVEEES